MAKAKSNGAFHIERQELFDQDLAEAVQFSLHVLLIRKILHIQMMQRRQLVGKLIVPGMGVIQYPIRGLFEVLISHHAL